MINEFRIDVRTQGAGIELEVSGVTVYPNPRTCPRQPLDITPDEFDVMRAGRATTVFVDSVTDRVSKWLQTPDLRDLPMILGLGAVNGHQSRVVFNVSHIKDDKLRYELADFPIEMATSEGDPTPLSLHNRVSSIIHHLPKVGNPPVSTATGWPFRVLIVRAGPTDLPAVPPAGPIATAIRAVRPELSDGGDIQIDVLSTEPGGPFIGPPTREKLLEQLTLGYHILVFLGHGSIREIPGASVPTGQLQLETATRESDSFEARKISALLHDSPVPVVLLIGCLTGAELTPEQLAVVEAEVPKWLRGSQGVAQALINSTSGVQCAVGMRYRIDGKDATLFLSKFFESLLTGPADQVGGIERAVKIARKTLYIAGRQPLSWAAPVVFRTLGAEPIFPFLAVPPAPHQYEIAKEDQAARAESWDTLAALNWSLRRPGTGGLYDRVLVMLRRLESDTLDEVRPHAAIIMPELRELDPGGLRAAPLETLVEVIVHIHKKASVRHLEGILFEASQRGHIRNVTLSLAAKTAGFELMLGNLESSILKFEIRRPAGDVGDLPEGPLVTINLAIGPAIETVYQLGIEALHSEPPVPLCGVVNAVIIPAP